MPTWPQAVALAIVCALGACGQWCLFEGARRAASSIMATVEYTTLIWAFVLGWLVFEDIPLAGGLLVTSERLRLRSPRPA